MPQCLNHSLAASLLRGANAPGSNGGPNPARPHTTVGPGQSWGHDSLWPRIGALTHTQQTRKTHTRILSHSQLVPTELRADQSVEQKWKKPWITGIPLSILGFSHLFERNNHIDGLCLRTTCQVLQSSTIAMHRCAFSCTYLQP